jgi:hypothetical protein
MRDPMTRRNFSSLSVRDLLDAREAYHVHLAHLENVEATAVGLYRMHRRDPSAKSPDPKKRKSYGKSLRRTLTNTVVTKWSWPCVLVFVKRWYTLAQLQKNPLQAIPRFLHLPDGRVVPTCVVLAERDPKPLDRVHMLEFPSGVIGGGYPCFTQPQGAEQVGTLGALVTRQGETFALTNSHVAGRPGEEVYRLVGGRRERIGASDPVRVVKKSFCDVYPDWPAGRSLLNMDIGLVRVDDVNDWSSQAFGIGEVGRTLELNCHTITLDLIGAPVRAFGAVSGPAEGEIYALFYRYRSAGGFDYVADLLIGPRTDSDARRKFRADGRKYIQPELKTRPGDSGAVVFLDPTRQELRETGSKQDRGDRARRLRPLAVLWGGRRLKSRGDKKPTQIAFATFLSTVCRALDVDILNSHDTGHREYWGKTAHFKIGHKFCDLLSNQGLKQLITRNLAVLAFPDEDLERGSAFSVGRNSYVPLADVPDYVWIARSFYDRSDGPRRREPMQHFADIDDQGPNGEPSLLSACSSDPDRNLNATAWQAFFASFDGLVYGPEAGALPFRVRQIYEAMVDYLSNGDLRGFVAAAGVLAHYVGDSIIPLHMSVLHHGDAPRVRRDTEEYQQYKRTPEYKVHSIFEQRMFEVRTTELLTAINTQLSGTSAQPTVTGGDEAIRRAFELMAWSFNHLPPRDIIDSDDPYLRPSERAILLYDAVGDRAADCVAEGCLALAEFVESAWREGNGDAVLSNVGQQIYEEGEMEGLYRSGTFLPAMNMQDYIAAGY